MKPLRRVKSTTAIIGALGLLCFLLLPPLASAQTFPTPDYFRRMHYHSPLQLPPPDGLRERVADGKLRLSLADTVQLVLANNTDVQIDRLGYEATRFTLIRAYQPFDPLLTGSFSTTRAASPTTSQLEGAQTLSTLNQSTQFNWSQSYQTGTRYSVAMGGTKNTTNSSFSTFNPSFSSTLNLSVTQPLLRNRWLFANRAPIVIARRGRNQSLSNFEAQVSAAIASAMDQYWGVVQARENLKVLRKSLEQAEATYKQNKRALELGALPPLDIYRSESQVATRRVAAIQAEYQLKQLEDDFRRTVGADLDPYIRALDLELTEAAEAAGELLVVDSQEALARAMQKRPELVAAREQLAVDDISVRLAHNNAQPDLSVSTFWSATGRGGSSLDPSTTPPTVLSAGGYGDAVSQMGSWNFPTYGFSLQLRLPIKNSSAEADLGNALVSQRRNLYSLRRTEQGIQLEVRNAVHQLEQAKLSMAASKIARDLALKNLEAEQRKYELGVQTIFFVLDAQTQLAQAEQDLLRSYISYQRALTALDRATGELLGRNNIRIDAK